MNWTHSAPLVAIAFIALLVALCGAGDVIHAYRRRRSARLLKRLNGPFFRNVYDAHYRVGNCSGLGR